METFFSLLFTAFSSIFYGVIATVVIMVFLYTLLKCIERRAVQGISFYITGVFLFVLLSVQMSLLIGSMKVKNGLQSVEIRINQIIEGTYGIVSANDSQLLLDQLNEEFPLMSLYVDTADFSGNDVRDIAVVMSDTIDDFLTSYIWRRIGWIVGMCIVSCVIALCFDIRSGGKSIRMDIPQSMDSTSGGLQF